MRIEIERSWPGIHPLGCDQPQKLPLKVTPCPVPDPSLPQAQPITRGQCSHSFFLNLRSIYSWEHSTSPRWKYISCYGNMMSPADGIWCHLWLQSIMVGIQCPGWRNTQRARMGRRTWCAAHLLGRGYRAPGPGVPEIEQRPTHSEVKVSPWPKTSRNVWRLSLLFRKWTLVL